MVSGDKSGIDGLRIDRSELNDRRSPVGTILVALMGIALVALGAWWVLTGRIPKVRTVTVRERPVSPAAAPC